MKVLMVCLGNICRSPLAEGILKHQLQFRGLDWFVDSAGTSAWHIGEKPHKGSIEIARQNGIDISAQKARQFVANDLVVFDLILAMDEDNFDLIQLKAQQHKTNAQIELILPYTESQVKNVPDPYYDDNFEGVYNLLKKACERIIQKHALS